MWQWGMVYTIHRGECVYFHIRIYANKPRMKSIFRAIVIWINGVLHGVYVRKLQEEIMRKRWRRKRNVYLLSWSARKCWVRRPEKKIIKFNKLENVDYLYVTWKSDSWEKLAHFAEKYERHFTSHLMCTRVELREFRKYVFHFFQFLLVAKILFWKWNGSFHFASVGSEMDDVDCKFCFVLHVLAIIQHTSFVDLVGPFLSANCVRKYCVPVIFAWHISVLGI